MHSIAHEEYYVLWAGLVDILGVQSILNQVGFS